MIDCVAARPLLFDYQAGALDDGEAQVVGQHARQCDGCNDVLGRLAAERRALRADFAVPVPDRLAGRVLDATRRRRRVLAGRIAAGALAGSLALWAAIGLVRQAEPAFEEGRFWDQHLQVAQVPQFRNAEQSPFLVQTTLAATALDERADMLPETIPNAPEFLPSTLQAPAYLPHGYILMGGRLLPDGKMAHLIYTDGMHLLSLFQGLIPGVSGGPVARDLGGQAGGFRVLAWHGPDRDYVLLGDQPSDQLGEMAARINQGDFSS